VSFTKKEKFMMKQATAFLILISTSSFSEASLITCRILSSDQSGSAYGLKQVVVAQCEDGRFTSTFEGRGLNLRHTAIRDFALQCPGKLNPVGTYYGVDANLTLWLGVDAGMYVSKSGVCLLLGVSGGLGGSLDGSRLNIKESAQELPLSSSH
jgi:hypothetical protein